MQIIDSFEQQIIGVARDGQIQISTGEDVPVYTIDSFHVLTQFVGYAKYINRQNANVYLRGQTGLYDGHLIPSIYRPLSGSGSVNYSERTPKYMEKVHQALSKSKAFDSIDSRAIVPLLQHYGIKTSWLDVVDNLWVALWFGLHKFHSIILQNHEYIHIYRHWTQHPPPPCGLGKNPGPADWAQVYCPRGCDLLLHADQRGPRPSGPQSGPCSEVNIETLKFSKRYV